MKYNKETIDAINECAMNEKEIKSWLHYGEYKFNYFPYVLFLLVILAMIIIN